VRKADNLPPSCAVFTKSGNLNFLEPSGPLRACNGTALPSLFTESGTISRRGAIYEFDYICTRVERRNVQTNTTLCLIMIWRGSRKEP